MVSSVRYTLAFITFIFDRMFSKIRTLYENNLILWYHQIWPIVVSKVLYGLMNTITITKREEAVIFCTVYHNKNNVIPHPVIAAILDVILNILQH